MDDPLRADSWDIYDRSVPPWETGRPQPAISALADAGLLGGRVLDVGCGTGEHALLAAAIGLDATGIDGAASAIRIAREKACDRGLAARFQVADALDLGSLDEHFDTVIDSSFFHIFSDAERPRYVSSLGTVVPTGGRCYVLCFSDRQAGADGPRRISQHEIRDSFAEGWSVDSIEETRLETNWHDPNVIAWLASVTRR